MYCRYGLIKPQKASTRLLAFASDSESDDEPAKKKISVEQSITQKRQARIVQEDALKEDPTIFQYDEVYDDMTASREEAKKAKSSEVRQSKYINKLLVAAEKRKIEYESRLERQVQKERAAEGDQFKDKEVFVTAAYRAKLETMKQAEEAAQREEYLENIGDVTKQKDLSGFYRHMYEQKLGTDKTDVKDEKTEAKNENPEPAPEIVKKEEKTSKRRTYRKHSDNENSDEGEQSVLKPKKNKEEEEEANKKVHLQSNLDADSDFSIDSDSDSDDAEKPKDSEKEDVATKSPAKIEPIKTEDVAAQGDVNPKAEETKNGTTKKEIDSDEEKMPPPKEVKPKIDVWKKRTVGDVYLLAVKRYYERKQAA